MADGTRLLDLYFLGHEEVPVFANWAGMEIHDANLMEPHAFAASLDPVHLGRIAEKIRRRLVEAYVGQLVGRRPRIPAMATFFPRISSLDPGRRATAVAAVANTMRLAKKLGCHCVEIVGGTSAPPLTGVHVGDDPHGYVEARMEALVCSLCEIAHALAGEDPACARSQPLIAMELEPGPSLLLCDLDAYRKLKAALESSTLPGAAAARAMVKLNLDVAHAFIIGLDPKELGKDYLNEIAHMHLSDHAAHHELGGVHASDLPPRSFHVFKDEFQPWLELAVELTNRGENFSKTIAIELEACMDRAVVASAMSTTRRWLNACAKPTADAAAPAPGGGNRRVTGALLVVDLGNSTEVLVGTKDDQAMGLEHFVGDLCREILNLGGSVMSFTGDGFIALFEARDFGSDREAAEKAAEAAQGAGKILRQKAGDASGLTYRAALHWGDAFVPNTGPLRDQILGKNVVCAARLCSLISQIEQGTPKRQRGAYCAATGQFIEVLNAAEQQDSKWLEWGDETFKGLNEPYTIHYAVEHADDAALSAAPDAGPPRA